MFSRKATDRVCVLAIPALLCVVALYQVYLVKTQNLTPWKGGGFGMFSTSESGASRSVRVVLVKRDGEVWRELPVTLPAELEPLVTDLRQQPTERRAQDLAVLLGASSWRESPELDALDSMSAGQFAASAVEHAHGGPGTSAVATLLETPRAWMAGVASTARFGAGRDIEFDHAVVEVWQLRYGADDGVLRTTRVVEAWDAAPRVAMGGDR